MKCKHFKTLFFLFFLLFFFSLHPSVSKADTIIVNVPVANIRKGPSQEQPKVGISFKGQNLEYLEKQDGWFKVRLPNSVEGWLWEGLVLQEEYPEDMTGEIEAQEETNQAQNAVQEEQEEEMAEAIPLYILKVTKPTVNIREGAGVSFSRIGSVKEGDMLTGMGERDGWYLFKTKDGLEAWIIGFACEVLPLYKELATEKQKDAIINSDQVSLKTGPGDAYPELGLLSMDQEIEIFLEEEGWLYVKKGETIEGWIPEDAVYEPEMTIDPLFLKEEILRISNKLTEFYDQKKKEKPIYQQAGWFPSFTLFQGEKDIEIERTEKGWSLGLTFSLLKISSDILFPMPVETVPISLSEADRLFFMTLIQSLMENRAWEEIQIHLRGLKRLDGDALKWVNSKVFKIRRSDLEGIDLDRIETDPFWGLLSFKRD